jgi:hypothetical protein
MKNLLIVLSIFCLSNTCRKNDKCHYSINIKNKSTKTILVDAEIRHQRTDTNIICPFYGGRLNLIPSNDSAIKKIRDCYEKEIKDGSTFDLFIIDIKNYDLNTPCDTIRKNCKVLFRKQYTIEDLEKINFTIEYK